MMVTYSIRPQLFKAGAIGLICVSAPAFAYHPLVTDDTGTQGFGRNQIEIGYDHGRSVQDGIVSNSHSFPLTYTRGVTDALDLYVGTTRLTSPTAGWSNVGLGAKWRFYENEFRGLSLGLEPKVQLPVSAADEARGLGNGKTSYSLAFLVTQNTSFGQLLGNVAVGRDNFADPATVRRQTTYRVSAASVWDVKETWRVAVDVGIKTNTDVTQRYQMGYVELGAIYSPNKNLDLSAGLIREVKDGPTENTTLTTEVTWRF